MKLRMLYFARLRESVGIAGEALELPERVRTIAQLRAYLSERGGAWAEALAPAHHIRAAMNQQMVNDEASLQEGAEVALFPPVTGG